MAQARFTSILAKIDEASISSIHTRFFAVMAGRAAIEMYNRSVQPRHVFSRKTLERSAQISCTLLCGKNPAPARQRHQAKDQAGLRRTVFRSLTAEIGPPGASGSCTANPGVRWPPEFRNSQAGNDHRACFGSRLARSLSRPSVRPYHRKTGDPELGWLTAIESHSGNS